MIEIRPWLRCGCGAIREVTCACGQLARGVLCECVGPPVCDECGRTWTHCERSGVNGVHSEQRNEVSSGAAVDAAVPVRRHP